MNMLANTTHQHAWSRLAGWFCCVCLVFSAFVLPNSVMAHEARPAYLQIDQTSEQRFNVIWRTPVLSGNRLPVLLRFSDGIEVVTGPAERSLPDSLVERSIIEASDGLPGQRARFVGLQATITDVLVRVKFLDGKVSTSFVKPSQPWVDFQAQASALDVVKTFTTQGVEHILFGFDHLLFVLALMLIVTNTRKLILTITAFTVAHSITLTFATLGWISLPTGPVEIMIAFSIVLIAGEIVALQKGATSLTISAPWIVAFAFGLLHGFGFASALTHIGLPQGDIPLALLFFNIGVELGQLMFVALILVTTALIKRFMEIPSKAVIASAYCIGIVAAFWTIERINSTFV